jgi:tRNA-dihydrouridine synthase A
VGPLAAHDPASFSTRRTGTGGRDLLSIAPMMDVTDRHYRTFMRNLTRHTKLYTEMYAADTLLAQGGQHYLLDHFLGFDRVQHPVAAQLGGDSPDKLAECTDVCRRWGYDEVNLNCGCPSTRAVASCFGAKLMLEPERVREITSAMRRRVASSGSDCPVTVKCRLGVDERDSYEQLCGFVRAAAAAGVTHFILHARKCLLDGLSTRQNREVPELRRVFVFVFEYNTIRRWWLMGFGRGGAVVVVVVVVLGCCCFVSSVADHYSYG